MKDLPIIGAQLTVLDLPKHRDWLIEKNRDLELPEFCMADILAAPDPFIDMAKKALDGWAGRLGIHGPFSGFELDTRDKEVRAVVQRRIGQALDAAEKLGATQMVLHSPYDAWDAHNLDNKPNDRTRRVAAMQETLAPALKRAEAQGVEIVIENIRDVDPAHRAALIEAADSPALKLSVDVGHAYWAHVSEGAPAVDRYISSAGEALGHVHLQDADGYADRHWCLGEGTIPFAPVFAALAGIGNNPRLIVEINEFGRVQEAVAHLRALGLGQ
ncbi:sugar phosphate isomerase/epimerase family protein [Sinisalibacter aestuarii]|uniref:Sugar phosphate isomerase n=1 Tax=Sinisalibacter aestuarii TaxID=2949426 RepID=A0ABQ5LUK1_9RHOB|nr:sugar phosphate isomerase/epimerase family protein [Sinisalibacter aestuarii]GKY88293.1 sugar phosphate isomerase [Sinisalibacter aestuarii]